MTRQVLNPRPPTLEAGALYNRITLAFWARFTRYYIHGTQRTNENPALPYYNHKFCRSVISWQVGPWIQTLGKIKQVLTSPQFRAKVFNLIMTNLFAQSTQCLWQSVICSSEIGFAERIILYSQSGGTIDSFRYIQNVLLAMCVSSFTNIYFECKES